jgi:hypothetical protein
MVYVPNTFAARSVGATQFALTALVSQCFFVQLRSDPITLKSSKRVIASLDQFAVMLNVFSKSFL